MPTFIWTNGIRVSTPQQNAGVFIGHTSGGNWDANMKYNGAKGGNFGILSTEIVGRSIMVDNLEAVDGVINTGGVKSAASIHI